MPEETTPIRKYGWKPSLPDYRDLVFKAEAVEINNLPQSTDLRANMPDIYDQGSLGSCHDVNTEILTNNGWKLFCDLGSEDKLASINPKNGNLIFEKPTRLIRFQYNGDVHHIEHAALDCTITPDHNMLVRKWNETNRTLNNEFEFIPVKSLGWYSGLMNHIKWQGENEQEYYILKGVTHKQKPQRNDKPILMSVWMKFLGIYLAEGTMLTESHRSNGGYKIQIAATKDREKSFIRQLLKDMDIKALELKDRFTFNNKQIYTALEEFGLNGVKAPEKFVPKFVFSLPGSQIKDLLYGHFMGDGSDQKGLLSHYTSSAQLASDLQTLILLSGGWSVIHQRQPRQSKMIDGRIIQGKYPEYRIGVWTTQNISIDKKVNMVLEKYNGEVFCAEVPTYHTLITRRNGKILISGNCTANATGAAIQYDQKINKNKYEFPPSRLFIYYQARALEGSISSDSGAMLRDVVRACATMGACPEYRWPYDISKFADNPSHDAYWSAASHKVKNYESVNQKLEDIQVALSKGFPVIFGFTVYNGFETQEVAQTGILNMPQSGEQCLGGHAVLIVGYDNSTQRFLVRNSWGPNWGQQGHFTIPYEYVLNPNLADDFWVIYSTD